MPLERSSGDPGAESGAMGNTEPAIALSEPSADEIKTTTCYMCACRCGIRVHLKDGRSATSRATATIRSTRA